MTYSRFYQPYTEAEDTTIRRMALEGRTATETAIALRRSSRSSVISHAKKMNPPVRFGSQRGKAR